MDFREELIAVLDAKGIAAAPLLEVPPDVHLGDFALPCFSFAKEQRKAPAAIAAELAAQLHAPFLEKVVAVGPYVNFYIRADARANAVITAANHGHLWQRRAQGKKVLIEYPSPNTNKPLHLGHVRNMVLGSTLAIMLKLAGNTVYQINLNNDRGVHICKSMLAYQRWGNGSTPNKKSDHFVGDFYVRFEQEKQANPQLEAEAQAMLLQWEQQDPAVRTLWKQMNGWALEGFSQTYKRYHIRFDKQYYESELYQHGKDIVTKHMDVFVQDETGAVIAPLGTYKLPDKVLLRKDGTSLYITQDIAFTLQKMHDFAPDTQIWVVANEQNLHFQQLFAILELIGVDARDKFHHLSYGMVALPEGRMKSREGRVVDADDILDELEALSAVEIRNHHNDWDEQHIEQVSKHIALSAIRFFMIKFDPARDFTFDPKSSLSFEGDSGPYLQYTHARICSILAKAAVPAEATTALLTQTEEQELLRQLSMTAATFTKATAEYKPNLVALQLLEIARAFNSFYHACPVLQAAPDVRDARLQLLNTTRVALAEGLQLLGIEPLKEM